MLPLKYRVPLFYHKVSSFFRLKTDFMGCHSFYSGLSAEKYKSL